MSDPVDNSATNAPVDSQSVWFSCATAALIASLEAVGARGKCVAIPPNVCPNVVAAVFGAGCTPYFVDIEPESQGTSPERLSEVIGKIGAAIAVHAYGTPCRIEDIVSIARQSGIPVIEDCAQAEGATVSGREVGTFGDIAVFSYGKGKIVEAGGGGLAIVNDSRWITPLVRLASQWESASEPAAGDDLSSVFRLLYNRFYPGRTAFAKESFFALVRELAPAFKTRCSPERIAKLSAARSHRRLLALARRQKYSVYVEQLAGMASITPIALKDGAAPWRFNAEVTPGKRDSVFRKLLESGVKASTWYPRMTEFLPAHAFRSTDLPVAKRFEQALLNLWVDDTTTDQDITQTCSTLKHALLDPENQQRLTAS